MDTRQPGAQTLAPEWIGQESTLEVTGSTEVLVMGAVGCSWWGSGGNTLPVRVRRVATAQSVVEAWGKGCKASLRVKAAEASGLVRVRPGRS